ncbi:hypothetical protein NDU88_004819 [Pleurodeles waltl]|uniref:Uncharacterized protein n=1 Tax=Pleurodeles waltl TaxID=8319 RepID=A0AAV7UHS9_PLEWA|nr:hypothetical protein NDU88_004819 [Pleurodeles waltl]
MSTLWLRQNSSILIIIGLRRGRFAAGFAFCQRRAWQLERSPRRLAERLIEVASLSQEGTAGVARCVLGRLTAGGEQCALPLEACWAVGSDRDLSAPCDTGPIGHAAPAGLRAEWRKEASDRPSGVFLVYEGCLAGARTPRHSSCLGTL